MDFILKVQLGRGEINDLTYNNITRVISQKVHEKYCQPIIFELVEVPAPLTAQVADLYTCKGYEHCDISQQQIEGFIFRNHMDVREDEILQDFSALYDELASCLKIRDA